MKPFSIYIHIPYCFQKCPYCDFNTYAVTEAPENDYTGALLAELDWRASQEAWKHRPVQTVYFGGGTPSLFSPRAIRKIISLTFQLFPVEPAAEITLEANPGSVTSDNLSSFREAGVNRLSFGAQSFTQAVLKTLGRTHSPEQVHSAVESARAAGFKNISIDLMYGVPNQTVSDLRHDLAQILALDAPHISAYGLTIEKGTPFYQSQRRGILKLPHDDVVIEMMNTIIHELAEAHRYRYEISNYALDGYQARHNLAYWNGDDYLGLGAGAHSFLASTGEQHGGRRWSNYALPQKYIESATTIGMAESWSESLDLKNAIFEFFFLGLRKTAGVSEQLFQERFGKTVDEVYGEMLDILEHENLIERSQGSLRLSHRGFELSDSVIENFSKPAIS